MDTPTLQRAYRTFVTCRQVIRRATSEAQLFQEICETAVTQLGFRLAWIGLISPDLPNVRPVAQAGYEDGYLSAVRVTWTADELGLGPTGRAIRERRPAVAQNLATDERFAPWRAAALARDYASSAALPIHDGIDCIGALNLYASEPDAFDDDELALLEEVALDLMLAVRHLRMRVAMASVERHLDRAIGVEAAAMAATALVHDFNNMLQAVQGSLEVADFATDEATRTRALDDARAAAQSMSRLGVQLLSLTRRAADLDHWSSVDQVVRGTASLLLRLARGCALDLRLDDGGVRVPFTSLDLERILVNLVVNARHAMVASGRLTISTELRVEAEPETLEPGTYVALVVEDEGSGISAEILPRIFEPLFSTKPETGTGLGLPAVLALVEPVGGGVTASSTVGEGTRITVLLPTHAGVGVEA